MVYDPHSGGNEPPGPIVNNCNCTISEFPTGVTPIDIETDWTSTDFYSAGTQQVSYLANLIAIRVFCSEGTVLPDMEVLGNTKSQADAFYSEGVYSYTGFSPTTISGDFSITFASAPTPSNKISIGSLPLSKMFVGNAEVSKAILNGVTLYEKEAPSGYTVTITNDTDVSGWAPDGSGSEEGAYVMNTSYNYVPYQSVSGNVAVFALEAGNYIAYIHNQQINSTEVTGGVVVNTGFYEGVEFTVSADGTLVIHGEEELRGRV